MSVKLRAKRVLAVLMSAVLLYGGLLVSPTVAVAEQAQASDVTTPQSDGSGSSGAAETDGIIVTVGTHLLMVSVFSPLTESKPKTAPRPARSKVSLRLPA